MDASSPTTQCPRVLVFAPERVFAEQLSARLRTSLECEAYVTTSAEAISDTARETLPHLLLMACAQSVEELRSLIHRVRSVPVCERLPVLAVCGMDASLSSRDAEEAGADDVISVDAPIDEFRRRILLLARLKETDDQLRASRARIRSMMAEHRAMLQRSVERFEALTRSTSEGIVVTDPAGVIRFMSPSMERILGWYMTGDPRRPFWDFIHEEDRPRIREEWDRLLESPMKSVVTEVRVLHRTRHWRWLRVVATNQLELPNVMGVVLNCTDIQEQRMLLDALRASQTRYRRLLGTIQEGIWVTDERDRTIYVTERMATMLGYAPHEMMKKTPEEFMFPEDVEAYRARMTQRRSGMVETYEHRFIRSDGTAAWFRIAASPMFEENGTYTGSFGMVQDITAERQSQREAREAAERLAAIIENTPLVAVQALDLDGTIRLWNQASAALYGFTAEEAIGQKLQDLLLPVDEVPRFLSTLQEVWESGQPTAVEQWTVYHRDGEPRHVLSTMVPASSAGQITCVYCMDVDITKRIEVEHQLEASRSELERLNQHLEHLVEERTAAMKEAVDDLDAFAFSVTHDLKAPLRIISGFSDMLLAESQRELTEKTRHNLKIIIEHVELMNQLIEALLQFSRCSRQRLSVRHLDMQEVTRAALSIQDSALLSRAEVVIGDLPPAYGDQTLIRQVLANLLSNALKYSRVREAPRVEVFWIGEQDGQHIYAVRDNGVGFDPLHRERIFHVFQRAHLASDFEGVGVGLAMVRRIIKRHGGDVWAESEPDQGATFYFTLPASKPEEKVEEPSPTSEADFV